ncbi:MAG: Slp family lipoprotein [bacterium]
MKGLKSLSVCVMLFSLALAGCAHVISGESRRLAATNVPFQWIAHNPEGYKGVFVIWGGQIIETRNLREGAHLVILQRPLGYSEEPLIESNSGGRFLVLYKGFLDPSIYQSGKIVTVAGIIEGEKTLPLDEIEYRYPYLNAKEIHLWKRSELSW